MATASGDCPALIPLLSFFSARVEQGVYAIPLTFLRTKFLSAAFGEASAQLRRFSVEEIMEAVEVLSWSEFASGLTLKPSVMAMPIADLLLTMVERGLIARCEMSAVLTSKQSLYLVTKFVAFAQPERPECMWEMMNPRETGYRLSYDMSLAIFCPHCNARIGVDRGGTHIPDAAATVMMQYTVACGSCTCVVGFIEGGKVVFYEERTQGDDEFDRGAEAAYRSYVESC